MTMLRTFYGPLKDAYCEGCEDYLVSHPGAVITIREASGIFGKAYLIISTVKVAVNWFRATGIEPLDSNIFTNENFQAYFTTDVVENNSLDSLTICQQPIYRPLSPVPTILSILSLHPST